MVYCSLPLWHETCQPGVLPDGETTGYISRNGHYFRCTHGSGGGGCYSTYFIIDRSSSMSYNDVRPQTPVICNAPGFSDALDNRLGVVYEAMMTYILTRRALSPHDSMAFIPFCGTALLSSCQQPITSDPLASLLAVTPEGYTCFNEGLQVAHQQLEYDNSVGANQGRTPVFILLTDSEDFSVSTVGTLQQIMQQEAGTGLRLHCLGFGTRVNTGYMEQLAAIGNGAFHNNIKCDDLAR